jgi:hypothetical protein
MPGLADPAHKAPPKSPHRQAAGQPPTAPSIHAPSPRTALAAAEPAFRRRPPVYRQPSKSARRRQDGAARPPPCGRVRPREIPCTPDHRHLCGGSAGAERFAVVRRSVASPPIAADPRPASAGAVPPLGLSLDTQSLHLPLGRTLHRRLRAPLGPPIAEVAPVAGVPVFPQYRQRFLRGRKFVGPDVFRIQRDEARRRVVRPTRRATIATSRRICGLAIQDAAIPCRFTQAPIRFRNASRAPRNTAATRGMDHGDSCSGGAAGRKGPTRNNRIGVRTGGAHRAILGLRNQSGADHGEVDPGSGWAWITNRHAVPAMPRFAGARGTPSNGKSLPRPVRADQGAAV